MDVSKIIGNNNIFYWILDIKYRISKEARVYCVLSDLTS